MWSRAIFRIIVMRRRARSYNYIAKWSIYHDLSKALLIEHK